MKHYDLDTIIKTMHSLGHKVFTDDSKPFNLNIVGVRSDDMTPDVFNDSLYVFWKFRGLWNHLTLAFTSDPGLYYLHNPMNVNGTIIMVPGQYRGVYQKGLHKGDPALRQVKPMKYFRDNNKDNHYNMSGKIYESIAYTNLHRAGENSTVVGKWSAGCQVVATDEDMELLMYLVEQAVRYWGNSFTYTLITETNL
jgi:hypothetical protein